MADITGPGITDRWGVTCTDLGASVTAPNGTLVSVFGDTFSGNRVGEGDWRSPVILIGTGDASHPITYHRAGGANPTFAQQLYLLPGSKLDVVAGVGLLVSQWDTTHGWPYRAMQFRVTLQDTTEHHRSTLNRESPSSGAPSI